MAYIGNPPDQFVIPVTLGADREFTVNRKDTNRNPINWAANVFIEIDIDKTSPTTINAAVTNDQAVVLLPSELCDQVKASTRWRLYMQTGTTPNTLTTPIAVGVFERDDGS